MKRANPSSECISKFQYGTIRRCRTELTFTEVAIILYMYIDTSKVGKTADDMLSITEIKINEMDSRMLYDLMVYNECAQQFFENINPNPDAVKFLKKQKEWLHTQYERNEIIDELNIC